MSELEKLFEPHLLSDVHDFWFKSLSETQFIVPSFENLKVWFSQSDEFDNQCAYV